MYERSWGTSCRCLDFITDYIKPGISTFEIDEICHKYQIENGAIPAPLNYKGFPNLYALL